MSMDKYIPECCQTEAISFCHFQTLKVLRRRQESLSKFQNGDKSHDANM